MKRILNFFKRKKLIDFNDFSKFSVPCNICNSDMLMLNEKELVCTNQNCQKIIKR